MKNTNRNSAQSKTSRSKKLAATQGQRASQAAATRKPKRVQAMAAASETDADVGGEV
jgi:hypothetical protein